MMLILFCWSMAGIADEPELPRGQIIEKVACRDLPEKSYALYLPPGYDPRRRWPVLLLFEPAARAVLPLQHFQAAAERHGYLLACSYDTQNFMAFEQSYEGVSAMWNDVVTRFSVESVYLGGFSGGARLATGIALLTKRAAGVIACGAGFNPPGGPVADNPFPMVLTVGTEDMNYLELADLDRQLAEKKIAHRHLVFDGGHAWPPEPICEHALAWLARLSPDAGAAAVEPGPEIAARLQLAEHWQARGQLAYEADVYRFLLDDFPDRGDLEAARARLAALAQGADLNQARKAEKKLLRREREARDRYYRRLAQGTSLPFRMAVKRRAEWHWWQAEADRLQATAAAGAHTGEALLAVRLQNFLRGLTFEEPIVRLQDGAFDEAVFIAEIAAILMPRAGQPYFNQACGHALAGRSEAAFTALATCLERGFPMARLEASPALAGLRQDPRYAALMKRPSP